MFNNVRCWLYQVKSSISIWTIHKLHCLRLRHEWCLCFCGLNTLATSSNALATTQNYLATTPTSYLWPNQLLCEALFIYLITGIIETLRSMRACVCVCVCVCVCMTGSRPPGLQFCKSVWFGIFNSSSLSIKSYQKQTPHCLHALSIHRRCSQKKDQVQNHTSADLMNMRITICIIWIH